MQTTYGVERWNTDIREKPHLACCFTSLANCSRAVDALLAKQNDGWRTLKIYLTMYCVA